MPSYCVCTSCCAFCSDPHICMARFDDVPAKCPDHACETWLLAYKIPTSTTFLCHSDYVLLSQDCGQSRSAEHLTSFTIQRCDISDSRHAAAPCRVHALERMCLSDVAEINTLHQQLHASQHSAWALREYILKFSMSD